MPNPTRDDIKQAAEHCLRNDNCHGCPGINTRCTRTLARAYLALREQVETVALPALRANLKDIEALNKLATALGVMPFALMEEHTQAAIKAIEEGQG